MSAGMAKTVRGGNRLERLLGESLRDMARLTLLFAERRAWWSKRATTWKALAKRLWREHDAMARGLKGMYEPEARTSGEANGLRVERDAARAEAQQARREKNHALHELGATRRDAEKAHEALKAEAGRLRGERDAGIVEIAALRARVAEAERVAVACNESAAANQLAAFTDREEAKRLRAAWAEAEPLVSRIGSNWAEDPRGDADRACAIMREALRGGAP